MSFWQRLGNLFAPRFSTTQRYVVREMTADEQAAFDAAFASMDTAFAALNNAFDTITKGNTNG